jgi:endoglucanase
MNLRIPNNSKTNNMNPSKLKLLHASRVLSTLVAVLVFAAMGGCLSGKTSTESAQPSVENKGEGVYPDGSFVAKHGRLHVSYTSLCDENGRSVLLKGISTHDFGEEGKYINDDCISFLAKDWHVTVMRAALYVDAYTQDPSIERYVDKLVDACEKNGIYCIIDWHVLHEHNPSVCTDQAKAFFARKAQQYAGKKHVIYEICNEPNGENVTWFRDVKPYAEAVIPVIRRYDPKSLIIVGTTTWSQDVDRVVKNPVPYGNVMYAFHFYAGTHGNDVKAKLRGAFERVPVFCSEWGTTNADGNGGPFPKESDSWLAMVESMGISWCNWSLSDANETSSLLKPGANVKGGWTDDELTPSGLYVRARLRK